MSAAAIAIIADDLRNSLSSEEEEGLWGAVAGLAAEACEPLRKLTKEQVQYRPGAVQLSDDRDEGYLNALRDVRLLNDFRFYRAELFRLRDALQMPEQIRVPRTGAKFDGFVALLLVLRRLSFPGRWFDLQDQFAMTEQELSDLFNTTVDWLHTQHGHLLLNIAMFEPHFDTYAAAVRARGGPLERCVIFVDGTKLRIAKPVRFERSTYCGEVRDHALKHQGGTVPTGIIAHFYGPCSGACHDSTMMGRSGFLRAFKKAQRHQRRIFVAYGDPAYRRGQYLYRPFKGRLLSDEQHVFNVRMSRVRIAVEWSFGKISNLFPFFQMKRAMKVLQAPVSIRFQVAALITNLHTCLYGCEAARYFGLTTPSLESYLAGQPDA